MNFEWVITVIGNEETVWQNNLRKITFVMEELSEKEFKSSIAIDIFGDRVDMMKDFNVWDKVNAYLNFRAKESNNRWWNSISAWRLERLDGASTSSAPQSQSEDLPF